MAKVHLSPKEAAGLMGVSRTTVISMIDKSAIPSWSTIGGHRRIDPDDVKLYLAARKPRAKGK